MRMREAMGPGYAPAFAPLGADLLADHPLDLAAVGAALRLAHHGADDGADGLSLAGPDLLDRVRVLGDRAVHDLVQLAALGAAQPLLLDHRRWAAALAEQHVEHLAPGARGDLLLAHQHDQLRECGRLERSGRGIGVPYPARQLVRRPVGERARLAVRRLDGGLEE